MPVERVLVVPGNHDVGFGVLPDHDIGVVLRADNTLVYASELYRKLARSYGLAQ
ncbi:MAG: hypothetical protein QOJ39_764 [Candidatus Eremiobacteraeota bacterium]|nr:hypothetical protein [Candidatus Eremiobacteraeota bacterium]